MIGTLLHAVHIIPKDPPRITDDERNGLILCHNHHDAFDAFYSVFSLTQRICLSSNGPTMNHLKIETDRLSPKRNTPHLEALQWRYKEFQKEVHERYGAEG